jgi:uncharacterized surface protein with fasciclin (FAS1) repeats
MITLRAVLVMCMAAVAQSQAFLRKTASSSSSSSVLRQLNDPIEQNQQQQQEEENWQELIQDALANTNETTTPQPEQQPFLPVDLSNLAFLVEYALNQQGIDISPIVGDLSSVANTIQNTVSQLTGSWELPPTSNNRDAHPFSLLQTAGNILGILDYMQPIDEVLLSSPQFSSIRTLLVAADMEDMLLPPGTSLTTFFAPNNDAIAPEIESFLLEPQNHHVLVGTLENHVSPNIVNFLGHQVVDFVTGAGIHLEFAVTQDGVLINDNIRVLDFQLTRSGILYQISQLILLPDVQNLLEARNITVQTPTDDASDPNSIPKLEFTIDIPSDIFTGNNDGSSSSNAPESIILPSDFPSTSPSAIPIGAPSLAHVNDSIQQQVDAESSTRCNNSTWIDPNPKKGDRENPVEPSIAPITFIRSSGQQRSNPSDSLNSTISAENQEGDFILFRPYPKSSFVPVPNRNVEDPEGVDPEPPVIDVPSQLPSMLPSDAPHKNPEGSIPAYGSDVPSIGPSDYPSSVPSDLPSDIPSRAPSDTPRLAPSDAPSLVPSDQPSLAISDAPTIVSGLPPYESDAPSIGPSNYPSSVPSDLPSDTPSRTPSDIPSLAPSDAPSMVPSDQPSLAISDAPTIVSGLPPYESDAPSIGPSDYPSSVHSDLPSDTPSHAPSDIPSLAPSDTPSRAISDAPSQALSELSIYASPLAPSGVGSKEAVSIVEFIGEADMYLRLFSKLIVSSGISQMLENSDASYTAFTPIDAAFCDQSYLYRLSTPEYRLHALDLVQYHLSSPAMSVSELVRRNFVTTLNFQGGGALNFTEGDGGVYITTFSEAASKIVKTDLTASNGMVHVISHMLTPYHATLGFMEFLLHEGQEFSSFYSLVVSSNLENEFSSWTDATLFAPENKYIPASLLEFLLESGNEPLLKEVVEYHVVKSLINYETFDVLQKYDFLSVQGENITIIISGDTFVESARVLGFSLTKETIVYRVDGLLTPRSLRDLFVEALTPPDASRSTIPHEIPGVEILEGVGFVPQNPTFDVSGVPHIFYLFRKALSIFLNVVPVVAEPNSQAGCSSTGGETYYMENGAFNTPDAIISTSDVVATVDVFNGRLYSALIPRMESFYELGGENLRTLMSSPYLLHLYAFTGYHTTSGPIIASDFPRLGRIRMLESGVVEAAYGTQDDIILTSFAGETARIIETGSADFGELHVIDRVLIPEWYTINPVALLQKLNTTFSNLQMLLVASGKEGLLRDSQDVTLFLPDNTALSAELTEFLMLPENFDLLQAVIDYHWVPEVVSHLSIIAATAENNAPEKELQTQEGSYVKMSVCSGMLFINDMHRALSYSLTKRGILYRIPALLVPPSLLESIPSHLLSLHLISNLPTDENLEFPIVIPASTNLLRRSWDSMPQIPIIPPP